MKKILALAGAVLLALGGSILATAGPASAGGSDSPTPYSVTAAGLTLPDGITFEDHGDVNVKYTQGGGETTKNIHFESLNNQPYAEWIGKSFLPWSVLELEGPFCIVWVQVDGFNEHFGEGGQEPVCSPAEETTPVKPEPKVREKTTLVCKAAARVTDFYLTPYVLVDGEWVLGKEVWSHKTSEAVTAEECGYLDVWREKVTIDCKGAEKNLVITDFYVSRYTFVNKAWVLGKEVWSHKTKEAATTLQCPAPTEEPTEEPTETTEPTVDPTEEPTTEAPTDEPTVDPTEEPTETPVPTDETPVPTVDPTLEPTDPPLDDDKEDSTTPAEDPTDEPSISSTEDPETDEPTKTPRTTDTPDELPQTGVANLIGLSLLALLLLGGGPILVAASRKR